MGELYFSTVPVVYGNVPKSFLVLSGEAIFILIFDFFNCHFQKVLILACEVSIFSLKIFLVSEKITASETLMCVFVKIHQLYQF